MNKQMLLGLVAGVGVATAGGVLGYQFLGPKSVDQQGSAAVDTQEQAPTAVAGNAQPAAAPVQHHTAAAPKPTQSASAPKAAPAAAPVQVAAAPAEECWDEQVKVENDPKDKRQLAGVGLGAAVGAAVGRDIGHSKLTTAVAAFGGALAGKKLQEKVQDNNADKRTETQTVRRCGPPGSRPQ
jgi:uncharacterized protein YcfJ